jgi:hypothetical protein
MCEEGEVEEGRGAGQNACTRSCVEATGGILSAFLGQKGDVLVVPLLSSSILFKFYAVYDCLEWKGILHWYRNANTALYEFI